MQKSRQALAAVVIVVGALSAPGCRTTDAAKQSGAEVYAENCNRCHNYRSPIEFTDERWDIIASHMRLVGHIPGRQARAVREFLITSNDPPQLSQAAYSSLLSGGPASGPDETMSFVERGEWIVRQKQCRGCHSIGGVGGILGPKLDGVTLRRGKDFFLRQLRNPRENNPQSIMPSLSLTQREVDSVIEYLRMFQ